MHQNHLHKENIHLRFPFWGKVMQHHSGHPWNSKLISKFSVFPHYLPVSWNNTVVKKNVKLITESLLKQKKQKLVHHSSWTFNRFVTFFYPNQACFPYNQSFHQIQLYIYIYIYIHRIHKEQIGHSKLPSLK